MERPHLRSISALDFQRWNSSKELLLSPKFQRRRIWQPKARSFLIDTILRGLPIPKLYMRQQLQLSSRKTIHEVVDGQQRIAAILDFLAGDLRLNRAHGPFGGSSFEELPEDAQKRFLSYEFSVDLLIDASDADVLDVFARINSYSLPLNEQEKRNAKFYGEFKKTAYALAWEHLEFWKGHSILTDRAIARMREAELTSELLVAMIDGLQDKKKSLNVFYERWDDNFPKQNSASRQFRQIIDLIEEVFGNLLGDTNFHRPALFYSLFFVMYSFRFGSKETKMNQTALLRTRHDRLRLNLQRLSKLIDQDRPPSRYARFVAACQRQTDNIQPRRIRHQTLVDELTHAAP